MKKLILTILLILTTFALKAQIGKHSVFVTSNYNISIKNSIHIDFDEPDFRIWAEPNNNFSWGAGYTYNFTDYFGLGVHFETEKIKFEDFYLGNAEAVRNVTGLHFQTRYPETALHSVTGGYFNLGSVKSDDFDNTLSGMEYGVFIGPALTIAKIEIALLFHPKFSYYFSDGKSPDSGLITHPRVSFKVGYALK